MWVWSVVGKLGFHMLLHVAKKKQSEQTKTYLNIFFFLQQTVLEHFWAIFCAMFWTYRNEYDKVCVLLDFIVFYKIYSCLLKKLEIKVKKKYITQWDHNPWITTVNILVLSLSTALYYHPKEVILCIPFVICSLLCHLLTRKYLSVWWSATSSVMMTENSFV